MDDITQSAAADCKRLLKTHLNVIDDIMLFPLENGIAVSLFNFIHKLYESTSFICEVINLTGTGYRMKNRKTIYN